MHPTHPFPNRNVWSFFLKGARKGICKQTGVLLFEVHHDGHETDMEKASDPGTMSSFPVHVSATVATDEKALSSPPTVRSLISPAFHDVSMFVLNAHRCAHAHVPFSVSLFRISVFVFPHPTRPVFKFYDCPSSQYLLTTPTASHLEVLQKK